jgi:hypothetical protein
MPRSLYLVVEYFKRKMRSPSIAGFPTMGVWRP